jgi:AcrR family transcriptional regulator
MRITRVEKAATRERIVAAALRLFRTQGFDATTTRDIARAAEIAAGTLFNYFPTKDAIVSAMAEESLARAWEEFEQPGADLSENLFALIAAELRHLRPLRKFILPLLETSLSPLAADSANTAVSLRLGHLERVAAMARQAGSGELSPLVLQVYWSLYTGVLAFWSADKSPKQEDTLALLDQSLAMFVAWLRTGGNF